MSSWDDDSAADDAADDGGGETWTERHARAQRPTPGVSALLGIGAAFGGCVAVGVFAGVLADHLAGTSPLFALLGVVVGIVVGSLGSYQVIRPYVKGRS